MGAAASGEGDAHCSGDDDDGHTPHVFVDSEPGKSDSDQPRRDVRCGRNTHPPEIEANGAIGDDRIDRASCGQVHGGQVCLDEHNQQQDDHGNAKCKQAVLDGENPDRIENQRGSNPVADAAVQFGA